MGARRETELSFDTPKANNMRIKLAFLLFGAILGHFAIATQAETSQDYDDRLANAEQNYMLSKMPKMFLWKLRYLAEHNNELNGPLLNELLDNPDRVRRGGKFNGLRRYG